MTVFTASEAENQKWMLVARDAAMMRNAQKRGCTMNGPGRAAQNSTTVTKYRTIRTKKNNGMRQFFCRSISMKVRGMGWCGKVGS
jgi:hypothetical protein